jgi:hypothetical protein
MSIKHTSRLLEPLGAGRGSGSIPEEGSGRDVCPWSPEIWRPDAVHHTDFYEGMPKFHVHRIESVSSWLPSLLVDWDMFRDMWKTAWYGRELKLAYQWVEQQRNKHDILLQQLSEEAEEHHRALVDLDDPLNPPVCDFDGYALWSDEEEAHLEQIAHIDARKAEIRAELQKVEQNYQNVLKAYQEMQKDLQEHLDYIFGEMGVLPNPNDFDHLDLVPVLDPDHQQDEDETQFRDWPENTWNNDYDCIKPPENDYNKVYRHARYSSYHEDSEATWNNSWEDYPQDYDINWLRAILEEKREEAVNAATRLENFRNTYDMELVKYIRQHRREQTASTASFTGSDDLEDQFGPLWLRNCQFVTGKAVEAEEDFYAIEERLNAAKHAVEVRVQEAGRARVNPRLTTTLSESEVQNFGEQLPSRKRKRIDDWLETDSVHSKQWKVQDTPDDTVCMFELSEGSDNVSVVQYAEGYQRRKIDNYVRQTQEAWPHPQFVEMGINQHEEILRELEIDAASVN